MQRGPRPLAKGVFVYKNTSCYPLPTPDFPARAHIARAMYKCALPLLRLTPSPGQTFARRPCLRPLCWLAGSPNRARAGPCFPLRPRCFALAGFAETQKCALPTARVSGAPSRGRPEPLPSFCSRWTFPVAGALRGRSPLALPPDICSPVMLC